MKLFSNRPLSPLSLRLFSCTEEEEKETILARMTSVINKTFTQDEIIEIQRTGLYPHQKDGVENLTQALYEVALQVREFNDEHVFDDPGPARWVALILDLILEINDEWTALFHTDSGKTYSVSEFRRAILADIAASDKRDSEDRWWSDGQKADAIRWLDASPYRKWVTINKALFRARESLEEEFFCITCGGGSNVSARIPRFFGEAARDFLSGK